MKKTDFVKPTTGSRLAAAFLLIAFISTTCQNPDNPAKPAEQKKAEEIEFPPPTLPTVTPLVFFLDDEYKPAAEDTGRTGITTVGDMPLNRVVVSSEDLEAEPVVHLFGRSVPDGVTTYTTATMFFAGKESVFPYKCRVVQRQEQRTEEYTASAAFSAYDDATETFSVDYENGSRVFNNLVLNKEVFGAYQFSNKVSESENIRMRNAVVAMALWTALEIQGEERGLAAAVPFYELNENGAAMYLSGGRGSPWGWIFLGISIAALALAVILCPPTSFALTASSAGISLLGTATITSTAATIAYGVAGVAALAAGFLIELEPPKDTPPVQPAPPSEKPSITGTAGPAGGTLVDKRDSGLN
ncbi:MAG: hypothetical protein LBD22_04160, partial [Spirochaetaceae bacterium]|nr:hypothetical protein [Spirochaetaceae bacterium]